MSEKVNVQFEVTDKITFLNQLQQWTTYSTEIVPATAVIGYRADDHVDKREALRLFTDAMEMKLRKNDHKRGWREKPIEALIDLMMLEVKEFEVALKHFTVAETRPELVDIANFGMMVWDRLGMLPHQNSNVEFQDGPSP